MMVSMIGMGIAVAAVALSPAAGLAVARAQAAGEDEKVGVRPYELDWAGRTQDDHPPLVDFENLEGWQAIAKNSAATFQRSREQQIWGRFVGKLTYRGEGSGPAEVRIHPPKPIPIDGPFDAVTLWCYGNNWGYAPDPGTPSVAVIAVFLDSRGQEFGVHLYHVDWTEWTLLHKRLDADQIARVKGGAQFAGILIMGGRQKDDRTLYFDNLGVYTEEFQPLSFAPRPERGVAMFPGQGAGTNTGPGKLPFPTTDRTILPPTLDAKASTTVRADGQGARFVCADRTGVVQYTYHPSTGRWDDIECVWRGAAASSQGRDAGAGGGELRFRPCVGGGIWLKGSSGPAAPEKAELLGSGLKDGVFEARWRLSGGGVETEATYRFRMWGKSLVMDVLAPEGNVTEVRYGRAVGLPNPRLITHPYYPADGGRPATAVFDGPTGPVFLMGNTDWYRTNASSTWAVNVVDDTGVTYNGGTRYIPLTDGRLAACYERFFLTLSPVLEETLPTIANPASPWKKITGTRVWRAHGAGDRESDKRYWSRMRRYGLTEIVVTDHETMWRDGGESFTFRTRTAPGKGGDEGARDYSRFMQDTLGFVYGPYNNFTDFAPVNEYWNTDLIARDPQNQLQHAWYRCYAPKPARAVEYCERLSPINQAKFGFSTAYCDVHTAVAPWHRVDYDPRVPGAGTMAAVFYSYGEIMLHQKKAWRGPVYSEGNYHAFYSGLTDGNYGQDQAYRLAENPWLVDFDLRRMHDLGCNFGMGAPDMFYSNVPQPHGTQAERDAWLDRFLAATVAFGHPGFLVADGGMGNALKSYYMLQQLHARYCLARAVDIRYVDDKGRLLTSSQAVASGAFRRSQIVTRYSDGTITAANGSANERMRTRAFGRDIDLPPNGYCGWSPASPSARASAAGSRTVRQSPGGGTPDTSAIEVLSLDRGGHRADYASTPEYIYVDGRGRPVRFARAASDGAAVCRRLRDGEWEVIPYKDAQAGFAVKVASATALDEERKPLGPAELRASRGLTYVMPVKGAFSYLLKGVTPVAPASKLRAVRTLVTPGERAIVQGKARHTVTVPADAAPGSRVWARFEGEWTDFTVVAPFVSALALEGDDLVVNVTSRLPGRETVVVSALGRTARVEAAPNSEVTARLPLGAPDAVSMELVAVEVRGGAAHMMQEAGLRTERSPAPVARMPERFVAGVGLRGRSETSGFGTTGADAAMDQGECGAVAKRCLKMHPPYLGNTVGYAYALYAPLKLPASAPSAFRALVGKRDGSDPGDGILFRVIVVDDAGGETAVTEHTVRVHRWEPIEADLTPWRGKTIRLKLVADPGPADNTGGDWAAWADMRIETLEPILRRTLDADPERYRRLPAPFPVPGLTIGDLQSAVRGWLRYDGKGLNAGAYVSYGFLNGVEIGALPEAGGDESAGKFEERVGVELPRQAIASLRASNRVMVRNPNRDFFSIRRFWIELELADGRRCSSDIADVTFTQPPEWPYAEGIRVPFGMDIEADIWFSDMR